MIRTVFAYISYDPIVRIRVGGLSISPHGIGIYIGYMAGAYVLFMPAAEKKGITRDQGNMMLILGFLGAIFGARFFYVINHWSEYRSIVEALKIWQGGLSLLGGITGAILFNVPYWRRRGFGFFPVMDAAVPGIALGLIFGRIGDLIIADHLGKETTFFLGYRCPDVVRVGETVGSPCPPGAIVHQPALYDLLSAFFLLVVLLVLRKKERYPGFLTAVFGLWYGVGRLIEDFLRVDKQIFGLTGSQWTALGSALFCAYILFIRRRAPKWGMGNMKDGTLHSPVEPIVDLDEPDNDEAAGSDANENKEGNTKKVSVEPG